MATPNKAVKRLGLAIPEAQYRRLKRLSTETHAPMSLLATVAIKRYLNGVIFGHKDAEEARDEAIKELVK